MRCRKVCLDKFQTSCHTWAFHFAACIKFKWVPFSYIFIYYLPMTGMQELQQSSCGNICCNFCIEQTLGKIEIRKILNCTKTDRIWFFWPYQCYYHFSLEKNFLLLQKSITLKGHYGSMFWVETTFPKIDFSSGGVCQKNVYWKIFQLQSLRNEVWGVNFRQDLTTSISFQTIHCKKQILENTKVIQRNKLLLTKDHLQKCATQTLFPVFIHWKFETFLQAIINQT